MKKTILDEVRQARLAVSEEFGGNLHNFFTWARAHASAEAKAGCRLPIGAKGKAASQKTPHPKKQTRNRAA